MTGRNDFLPGSVRLVGAGPGDPDLLTIRALHALQGADVVMHDALIAPEILDLAGPQARLEHAGKRAGDPASTQLRINQRMIALARAGNRVVRLKSGDPLVFGRGGEEALALQAAAIPFEIVPGLSAGLGGTAHARIPLTHRHLASSVTFVTGHHAANMAELDWQALARASHTLVLYMGRRRLAEIAASLIAAGRRSDEPVALLADVTTPRERRIITTLAQASERVGELPREAAVLIVIGPTVPLADLLGSAPLDSITPVTGPQALPANEIRA